MDQALRAIARAVAFLCVPVPGLWPLGWGWDPRGPGRAEKGPRARGSPAGRAAPGQRGAAPPGAPASPGVPAPGLPAAGTDRWGYAGFLATLRDPRYPAYDALLAWGGDAGPPAVDPPYATPPERASAPEGEVALLSQEERWRAARAGPRDGTPEEATARAAARHPGAQRAEEP